MMKKKYLFLLSTLLLFCNMSSAERANRIAISMMTLNQIIYDYFYHSTVQDSIAFRADSPWLLSYDKNQLLLFNSEKVEEFKTINNFPATNHLVQCQSLNNEIMPDFTEYTHLFNDKNILFLNFDKEMNNLDNLSEKDRLKLLIHLTQQQYISYLKNFNRELIDIPSFMYPITDIHNLVLSSIEYNILFEGYLKTLEDVSSENKDSSMIKDEVLKLLKNFYAVRLGRWRSQNSFVQTYELSQEKVLGLSYFKAFELMKYLEELKSIKPRNEYNSFIDQISTVNILHEKFYSILDGTMISINSMSKDKSENKGFLLSYLFHFLGWNYEPETSRDNFHVFLGNQLSMRTTEIDSLYNTCIESLDFEYQKRKATVSVEKYLNDFEKQKEDYNLLIYFDHYTEDYFDASEEYFVNSLERQIIFPKVNKYKIKSPFIEIDIMHQGFLYNMDRRNKNIQTNINTNFVLSIDYHRFDFDKLPEEMHFEDIFFRSNNLSLKIKSKGVLYYKEDVLTIKLDPMLQFYIEEEYWELINELHQLLVNRGVSAKWFIEGINHENFRVYHSIVRYFTQMPEHQVTRGERDQNWYMRHFGVDEKIRKGAEFRRTHRNALLAAEKRHGIHYELLMAIMAIESDYANPRWRGNFYTFPALVSQYILLPRRQRFATNELVALYQFSEKTNKDQYHFIGSFAGAAGWGQFIPSSMNNFFIDSSDNFYDVDIFSIEDTLHSISNYLFRHGLSGKNMSNYQARFRAVRSYNHSDAYARAVLQIYDGLRKQRNN